MIRRLPLAAILLVLAGLVIFGPAGEAQTLDELYEAARREGQVNLYSAHREEELTLLARLFEEKYPGIRVSITRKSTGPLVETVEAERMTRRLRADVIQLIDATPFYQWKREGFLAQYEPPAAAALPEQFTDPEGYMYAADTLLYVIGYNPNLIPADEVPRSWQEFVDPKWTGKTVTSHPAFSGGAAVNFSLIIQTHGWDWVQKLAAIDNLFVRGHAAVARMVITGERPLALISHHNLLQAKDEGQPIELVLPEEGIPAAHVFIAIPKDAPHPNAARLFLNFMLTEEASAASRQAFILPAHPGAGVPGLPPVTEMDLMLPDYEWLLANEQEFIERFDDYFGRR